MSKTYTWHMDAELAALVQEMAEETGRTWVQIARSMLLNGMAYTLAIGFHERRTTNVALAERIALAQMAPQTDMPVAVHELEIAPGAGRN